MRVTHASVVAVADDGTSPVGSDEWNEDHIITGNFEYHVDDYGAVGDGTTDDTAAIQDAIDAAIANAGGGTVYFGAKVYKITSTLTIDGSYVTLKGEGKAASKLLFVPSADDTAIHVETTGNSTWFCRIVDLWIYSSDTTHVKIALDLVDVRSFFIERLQISGADTGIGGTNQWGGGAAGSIGIRTQGREFIIIDKDCNFAAERPIQHKINPNSFIDLDHCRIEPTLVGDGYPCIEIEDGAYLSSTTWGGSWNGGTYGFYWNDTSGTLASGNIVFRDLRSEQGQDVAKESIYIVASPVSPANGIHFDNVACDLSRPAWYLRNINFAGIYNCIYGGTAVAIDWDNTVDNLAIHNCYWQSNSTIVKGSGVNTVYSGPLTLASAPLSGEAYYSTSTATLTGDTFIANTSAIPDANDGASLGISGTAWSDLFLASGAVINWNAGATTLTHSASNVNFASTVSGGFNLVVQNSDPGATGSVLTLFHNSATPAAADAVGNIIFNGNDSAPAAQQYAIIQGIIADPAAGAEYGNLMLGVTSNAVNKAVGIFGSSSSLSPNITDTFALGTSSLMWSDLFLASGGVINFNAGNVTLTHATGALALSGELRVLGDTSGVASANTLTGTSDLTANSTGVGSIKFKGTTSRDSSGFIKFYIGTTAYYVPVFSDITG